MKVLSNPFETRLDLILKILASLWPKKGNIIAVDRDNYIKEGTRVRYIYRLA